MQTEEVNFDGLVGPTHNYAGLAFGYRASQSHQFRVSNPAEAAQQGLQKMKFLMDLGVPQALLPPHERPAISLLRRIGYTGTDTEILEKTYRDNIALFTACFSASSMWTANAATFSPSTDTQDARVHITPANLVSHFHRSLEWPTTSRVLKKIFAEEKYFVHHDPLPLTEYFGDEGAANHTRFCRTHQEPGIAFFVFGRYAFNQQMPKPTHYPARQTFEASQAISRLHKLNPENVIFAQQNPEVIDVGVFHNDVISVGNQSVFLYHEEAFVNTEILIQTIQEKLSGALLPIRVSNNEVSVQEAVQTYLFNSQLITLPDQTMALIAPQEAAENDRVKKCLEKILQQNNPIQKIHFLNCRQSMMNGGGPACLRWRAVLNSLEFSSVQTETRTILTEEMIQELSQWIARHYRDRLTLEDLRDPHLIIETRTALDELTKILKLQSIYEFQMA